MTDHEKLVEAGAKALTAGKSYGGWAREEDAWRSGTLIAEKVIAAVEPLIRADERERWGLGWVAAADNVQALAHAEAVAARLVEVIRVDDLRLRTRNGHIAQARRERDAARAEVERLRERPGVFDVVRGSCGHKWLAEHTGLDWCPVCTDVDYKVKAKLADLRAKVEGLDESGDFLYRRAVDQVLALIEEVDRG